MTLEELKNIFDHLSDGDNLSFQVLQINSNVAYVSREIYFEPKEQLEKHISEIGEKYGGTNGYINTHYTSISEYNGSADGQTIYELEMNNSLIAEEYVKFNNVISNPNKEIDPFDMKLNATIISITVNDKRIRLISMQNPITTLKHKFFQNNGKFTEIEGKILSLKSSIDVLIIDDSVYFLTMAGERLFNMERAYKKMSNEYADEICASDLFVDSNIFKSIATTGHNPRRFISYNRQNLEKMKKKETREYIARKFNLPLVNWKIDTTQDGVSEKVVKLLCDKGMVNPFEDSAMEVSNARKWQ